MVVTPSSIVNDVRPVQLANARIPIVVTLAGMVNEPVRPVQPLNASFPIVVTLSGIVNNPVRPMQLKNAEFAITVMLSGMINEPVLPSGYRIIVVLVLLNNMPFSEAKLGLSDATFMEVSPLQP